MIFSKKNQDLQNHLSNNSAKNTKLFSLLFFGTSKKIGIAKRSVAWRLQGRIHGSKSLTPGSPFRISAHRSSFPPCGENQFRSFDPRPRREVRNGGWFHRLELLLWVSWDFVNMAFGGKVVTPQGWSAFANILYVYRSIYKYIYIAYIPAVPNHLHPKKLT